MSDDERHARRTRALRWQRARVAGGVRIDEQRWAGIVGQAVEAADDAARENIAALIGTAGAPMLRSRRATVMLDPGDVVLRAHDVLGLEMALVEAEDLSDEIRSLADDAGLDDARRERLLLALERAKAAVQRSINQRGQS